MARHGHSFGTDSAERSAPAFAAAFPVAAPAQAPGNITDYNWVGDSGAGGNGDWNTSADWSPAAVPGDSASATFATGNSGYTVTGDATIGAITVDGDGVTFDGAITQDTGVTSTFLTGLDDAYVTLDANSFFSGGNINFADGSLLDVQGILLTTGGTADVVIVEGLSGQAITSSALTVNQLYVQTGGSFTGDVTLNDGGSITLDTSSTFGGDTITLLGSGTIYEALAPGATSGNAGIGDAISIASGGTLTLASDPGVDFAVAGPISGAGDLLINGGTVELTGVNTYTGSTQVQNGTLIADGQGAVPGGLIIVTDGEVITQPDSTGATNFTDSVVAYGTSDTVSAVAGNLLVFSGLSGSFTFIGGAGSDTVVGDAGALSVTGGSVGDLVYGGAGAMSFTGGAGSSTVYGGSGGVTATGGSGGDLIYGTQGQHDVLYSGTGPATLVGGNGAQLFATGSANTELVAGGSLTMDASASAGNDTLFGAGAGTMDTMTTSAGTSTVVLGDGATTLFTTGTADVFAGAGALTLDYVAGFTGGTTNVLGFNTSQDQISLFGYAAGTAAQMLANETITGGSTILQVPEGDKIVLFGVTNLTGANFT
jgi:autotransporter-associated beta strand protein